ncbi:reverse transcriptase domain-containing protein [Tanacetum coccineum]|uniref:Reverse transcriptase domain-containing protein n=1 Tax=Tanacetum coccineum TaxID=301880 RepID=A0ABQ5J207_9ASTR
MPTWCHMFNSKITGNARVWFDDLPQESIDSYDDLRKAFLENYLQQKKCIKDPVEIHNIKQRDGESMKEFERRYKLECKDVKGAPEFMKIFEFMHGITNPELIKRLHDNIPKSVDEMMRQETGQKQNFKKGSFRNQQRMERKQGRFTLLTKTLKEILALDKGKQIEEMLKAGKLSHLIKELKQNNGKDQTKTAKKGETSGKDKSLAILMVQPWQRIARQRITQTFSLESVISFPPLGEEDRTEGPMIIEAEMEEHCVHHIHTIGRVQRRNNMATRANIATGEDRIIGRPRVRKIRAIPSTAHGMLKFPVAGGIVTLRSSKIIPLECTMVSGPGVPQPDINQVAEEKIQVAIHPEYPKQTVAIGSTLTEERRKELCGLLRRNLDIFAWKPAYMTGVPRHIAKHRLNIRKGCLPVRQKKKGQAPERNKAICEEVKKLVDADIMKEVHYHSWLSNPVMVKKHDGSWRMCVDFKDLNKACPKDGYPLPEID